ncbi:hypothetical protein HYV10_01655 [Candidatus Dependentiae bacterium]|nr:hypothetical protein [Candidatus Dependentiae bacterium]
MKNRFFIVITLISMYGNFFQTSYLLSSDCSLDLNNASKNIKSSMVFLSIPKPKSKQKSLKELREGVSLDIWNNQEFITPGSFAAKALEREASEYNKDIRVLVHGFVSH